MMPDAPEEIISAIEEKLKVIEPLTTMLDKGMTQEDILNELVGDFDPHILDKIPVEYYCNCSKERVEKALISIGKDEIQDIIENEGSTSLHCHFCNKDYEFSKEELEEALEGKSKECRDIQEEIGKELSRILKNVNIWPNEELSLLTV